MNQSKKKLQWWMPVAVAALCALAYGAWLKMPAPQETVRTPMKWNRTGAVRKEQQGADVTTLGPGKPSALPGDWPGFRGPRRDNIAETAAPLPRTWPAGGPKVLWRVAVGEGHAGAAVHNGRVYLIDYDQVKKEDAIRCLSLDDGREIWRTAYPVKINKIHGITRTVPAVTDKYVVTIGPKHHAYCCDAATGRVIWKKDFTAEFGTDNLQWYAGQCPLIDGERVILAPAGKPLMMAVDLVTGKEVWRTKDHEGMGITHSSIAVMTFDGKKQYLYCTHQGVVSVAADDGKVLWTHPGWKINIAVVATPLVIDKDRIFFSGGYGAGCQMVQLVKAGETVKPQVLWQLKATNFGSDQQTAILYKDHLYGTIPPIESGEMACLDLTGKRLWTSPMRFALGPFMMTADGLTLALCAKNGPDEGSLVLATMDPAGFKELAKAKLLKGPDCWGPMALAGSRLILRDLTEMICVDLGQ